MYTKFQLVSGQRWTELKNLADLNTYTLCSYLVKNKVDGKHLEVFDAVEWILEDPQEFFDKCNAPMFELFKAKVTFQLTVINLPENLTSFNKYHRTKLMISTCIKTEEISRSKRFMQSIFQNRFNGKKQSTCK